MARSRRPAPHRTATRRAVPLRAVGGEERGSADQVVSALTRSLIDAIAAARTPLQAEQALCRQFGLLDTHLPAEADASERADVLVAMLTDVIDSARGLGGDGALALLRVCAALGPDVTRERADLAARAVAAAATDRPWAARLGRPTMLRAWRYGDAYGAQSSIGVVFDDRGREHVLMVLIDHVLGGGVKDVWIATGADTGRVYPSVAARFAGDPEGFLEDLDAARAARLLREALAAEPCPEQPDQIDDVAAFPYLLRSRTEHLAAVAGLPPAAEDVEADAADAALPRAPATRAVLRLRVTSSGGAASSSRVLEISATLTLHEVHELLADAFALDDAGAYRFEHLAPGDLRPTVFDRARSRRVRLERLVAGPGKLVHRNESQPGQELRIDVIGLVDVRDGEDVELGEANLDSPPLTR